MTEKKSDPSKNKGRIYFRVSVFDGSRWWVKHAGKTQAEAEELVIKYFNDGEFARMSACGKFDKSNKKRGRK